MHLLSAKTETVLFLFPPLAYLFLLWKGKSGIKRAFLRRYPSCGSRFDRPRNALASRSPSFNIWPWFLFSFSVLRMMLRPFTTNIPPNELRRPFSTTSNTLPNLTLSDVILRKDRGMPLRDYLGLELQPPDWFRMRRLTSQKVDFFLAHRVAETHIWNMMCQADNWLSTGPRFCFLESTARVTRPPGRLTGSRGIRSGLGVIMGKTAYKLGIAFDGITATAGQGDAGPSLSPCPPASSPPPATLSRQTYLPSKHTRLVFRMRTGLPLRLCYNARPSSC